MVEPYSTLVNADNITILFGFLFVLFLVIGAIDLGKNIEKIGE